MAEKKLTDGSLALEQKKKRVITIEAAEMSQDIKLRVAAYARVSSASDDQLNSFAAQNKYYTSLISAKDNWSMVDIYADEGITGTSVEKREDFKRLLADCRRGKVDRVLVKSISRFSRNTKECLESIRELKSLGVSIYFINLFNYPFYQSFHNFINILSASSLKAPLPPTALVI